MTDRSLTTEVDFGKNESAIGYATKRLIANYRLCCLKRLCNFLTCPLIHERDSGHNAVGAIGKQ